MGWQDEYDEAIRAPLREEIAFLREEKARLEGLLWEAAGEIAAKDSEPTCKHGRPEHQDCGPCDETEMLRLRLNSILEWHRNWDAPFHEEDEWIEDRRLAEEAVKHALTGRSG